MSEVQLPFVLRLNAVVVKDGVDRICIRRLDSSVYFEATKKLVFIVKVVVDTAGEQPFMVSVGYGLSERLSANATGYG